MKITKAKALEIILQAAQTYQKNFNDKNLLIIYGAPSNPQFIEAKSLSRNFLHLTGMRLNNTTADNSPERFFEKALSRKLSEDDFEFKDKSAEQKLEILCQTLNVSSNARMIGDFSENRVNLRTDKVVGGVNSFIGFIKVNGNFIPNTVINGNIKLDTYSTSRVLAILSKGIDESQYNHIKYVAKKIDIERLLETLKNDVSISSELISKSTPSISASQNNVNIVSFSRIDGSSDVLTAPRFSFGQALANLINKWADKIQEGIENRRRELQSAKEEITELKQAISERDEQLTQKDEQLNAKDDEIAVLHKQNTALTVEMYDQRKLIQAANPPKTLSQKIEEAKRKSHDRNAANPRPNLPNQNRHKR